MPLKDVLNKNAEYDWFVHDRFGLFIHWGIYALPARHEWVMSRERIPSERYRTYFDHFDPDLFDPKDWARRARQAGMRYFVVTSKHHDGFCLWDSKLTDYKATNTPAKRDLLAEMIEAFRAEGLRVGLYHSLIDWHHPDFPIDGLHPMRDDETFREKEAGRDIRAYTDYLHGQVDELLTSYGTIDYLWFDFSYPSHDWGWAKGKGREDWRSEELVKKIHKLQPKILLNNRLGIPDGGVRTPEQYQPRAGEFADAGMLTEECHTLNGSWGYDRDNLDWKSSETLVKMLVDSVARGGNLLLNVGPDARGRFEPRACERLEAIGHWMELHGRSIYGAGRASEVAPDGHRFTRRGNRLYLHLWHWPLKALHLDGMAERIEYAQFLHDASEVRIRVGKKSAEHSHMEGSAGEDSAILQLPVRRPDVIVPVVELFLKDGSS